MKRYRLFDGNMCPDDKGPWVHIGETDSEINNLKEALSRRHREVLEAVTEERDDLRRRMEIVQEKAIELQTGLIRLAERLKS